MKELLDALAEKDMFVHNEHYDEYLSLVGRKHDGKGEKHHILPRAIYPEFIKSRWNIVNLRLQDHYTAHYLLTKCVKDEYLKSAIQAWTVMTAKGNYEPILSPDEYAEYKIELSKRLSGPGNPMFGKTHSEEVRKKLSEVNIGRKWTEEMRDNASKRMSGEGNHMFGNTHTKEVHDRLSEIHKGKKLSPENYAILTSYSRGEMNGMFGRNHSESSKQKMSEAKATYEYEGRLYSLNQLAESVGTSHTNLAQRLSQGMQLKDALSFPTKRGGVLGNTLLKAGFVFFDGVWYNPDDGEGLVNQYIPIKFNNPKGSDNKKSVLNEEKALEIKRMLASGVTHLEIAKHFGVSKGCINHISNGRTWNHVHLDKS